MNGYLVFVTMKLIFSISILMVAAFLTTFAANQSAEAMDNQTPKIIEFGARWCRPCREAKPAIRRLQKKYRGKLDVVEIDVDDPANRSLMDEYGVTMLPTFVFRKSSNEYRMLFGYSPNAEAEMERDAKDLLR